MQKDIKYNNKMTRAVLVPLNSPVESPRANYYPTFCVYYSSAFYQIVLVPLYIFLSDILFHFYFQVL